MAGVECGASTACPSTKRKAAEAALDEDLSDGDDNAAPSTAAADAPAPASELDAAQQQQGQQVATAPAEAAAPRRRPKQIMSQEWIDSLLADEIKPLPFTERHLRDPVLAEIFHNNERSRAEFIEYQGWIRRELATKGYVEVDDDYDERCELLQAVSTAAFYGREEEEEEAMAKLAALRRRR